MKHRWCGYEVSGMILLRYLRGAMRLDRSKDISVRVSTCISYDLNALTPVVALIRRVSFSITQSHDSGGN
jgi:hypothetical protein